MKALQKQLRQNGGFLVVLISLEMRLIRQSADETERSLSNTKPSDVPCRTPNQVMFLVEHPTT
ncbi:hypothetical protein DPMN_026070 [Dreissena polymorpha]|uniref:Uncharacterized protein n=1 Tax=Dreissena polymorpha TaxID=45954 RepID=A0A9D4LQE0_DREPO|nr:hypothetical protein DPMN_026070 [Dreissena polymorpha]